MSEETKNLSVTQSQTVQPTSAVKTADPGKPETVQTTAPVKAPAPVQSQPTDNTAPTASTKPAGATQTTTTPADSSTTTPAGATQTTTTPTTNDQQSKPAYTSTTEPPKNISDVVPSTVVWLSGMVGQKQFDCAGPFSVPFLLDKPTWPYVTVAPNPEYTNQVFDYDADGGVGKWVPTDAKSQGQLLTDLTAQVSQLSKTDSQSQSMNMQQTQMMTQLNQKYDTINDKLDKLLNSKDGDK